jgi:hypothetical protein
MAFKGRFKGVSWERMMSDLTVERGATEKDLGTKHLSKKTIKSKYTEAYVNQLLAKARRNQKFNTPIIPKGCC